MNKFFFAWLYIGIFLFGNIIPSTYAAKRKLDILLITDKFPWASRPFINNQVKGLLDRGHRLWIWCTMARSSCDKNMTPFLADYNWENKIFYKQLPTKRKYDILLCQFGGKGLEALKQKKKGKLTGKIVTCFRGEDITARLQNEPHRYDVLLQKGDCFLPVCDYFKQCLIRLGADARKITVIHSAIDCNKFEYQPRKFDIQKSINLISVNRLTIKKGTIFGIMAAVLLKQQYPALTYTIIGGGPLEDFFTYFIKQLNADNYIKLVGKLPHDKVAYELQKSHIFLLPSVTSADGNKEGIPNVLMEAMAVGLPVVSTYHAGIPELVQDGQSGYLVPERDILGLIEKIEYLIEHPQLCTQMGKKGRAYVKLEHNADRENDKLEQLLLAL